MASVFTSVHPAAKKISKVRWAKHQTWADVDLFFATGTWDEEKENVVTLWKYPVLKLAERVAAATDFPHIKDQQQYRATPTIQIGHVGDVTDMEFFDGDLLLTTSSRGFLNVYKTGQVRLVETG
ncbi:hypothetical protein BC938DRAFT_475713 [Jimgerdemannia flammicorona]|uniref:WD40-repeat-containing domain protein n=1 Tax=Jimgerdemannia flammicorona TaxID=994334 RepID=A0A433PPS7_9FUNG|nr:hypothetical protein BC938DRAFT_475713 [Jimgerdemannia flammicorona]